MSRLKVSLVSFSTLLVLMLGTRASRQSSGSTTPINVISADHAANASSPAFTEIKPLTLTESAALRFVRQSGGQRLIIKCPIGWKFKAGIGSVNPSRTPDITAIRLTVENDQLIVHLSVRSSQRIDQLNISGIQVQPVDGARVEIPAQIELEKSLGATLPIATLIQTPGIASKLSFTERPQSGTANQGLGSPIVVSSLDQFGNVSVNGLRETEKVRLKLFAGTGKLVGTLTANIGSAGTCGTATFEGITVDAPGVKKLAVTCSNLTLAITPEFLVEEEDNATRVEADFNPDWVCYVDVSRFKTP